MVTVTSRRAKPSPKEAAARIALATELLKLYKRLKPDSDRIDVIEAELKKLATDANDTFTETLAKLGVVKVAPAVAGEFKGNVPQIQTEAWLALPKAEQKRLEKSGLIKVEAQYGRKSSGRVTVELFEA